MLFHQADKPNFIDGCPELRRTREAELRTPRGRVCPLWVGARQVGGACCRAVLVFVALVHRALGSGSRVLAAWVSTVVVRMDGCRDFHLENGGRASPELGRPRSLCVLCFASTLGAMKTVFTTPTDEHRALKDLAVGWCVGCLCAAHALSSAGNNGTRRAKVDPPGPA